MPELPPLDALAPTPDGAELLAALTESVDRIARGIDARQIDAQHQIPPAVLEELAELGMPGLSLPAEHGGFGFGLWATGSAIAHLARTDRSVATTVGLHLGLGSRGLVAFASPTLQAATLPAMASGASLGAFAMTEPGAGSDLGGIRTRAILDEGTGRLRIDGSKIFVTNGGLADLFTIVASTPGLGGARRGQSVILLRHDDPGVQVGAEEDKLGLRGSSTTTLNLDGVSVGMDRIIGQPGQGRAHAGHILGWGRTAMAAGCCGTAYTALRLAREHCAQRRQFGRHLDQLPVVARQLEDGQALLFTMEALVRHTSWEPEHFEARSLAAKIHASEGSWELADLAVQLHGGTGYIEESGVPLLLRDARITRIFEGANDVLRIHLGLLTAAASPRHALTGLGELGQAADAFSDAVDQVATTLREKLGARLGRAQVLLHAMGSLAVLRAACDAAVLRARHAGTASAHDLAGRWLLMARRRAMPLHDELRVGIDDHLRSRQARSPTPRPRDAGPPTAPPPSQIHGVTA